MSTPAIDFSALNIQGVQTTDVVPWDRFILLAGEGFAGKSRAASSFPNPLFLNFDDKSPVGVRCIPFHSAAFCDSLVKRANAANPPNKRDAFIKWVEQNANKLPPDTTLVLDSLSSLETWWHTQTEDVEKIQANAGGGQLFGQKLKWFSQLFECLKQYGTRVVINAHLVPVFNKDNQSTGKVKALISGSFAEKIPTYCTSVIRAYVKPNNNSPEYFWRIKPDTLMNTCVPFTTGVADVNVTAGAYQAMVNLIANKL